MVLNKIDKLMTSFPTDISKLDELLPWSSDIETWTQPTLVQQHRGSAQVGRNLKEESSDGGSWFYLQQSLEKFCLDALMLNIMGILVESN